MAAEFGGSDVEARRNSTPVMNEESARLLLYAIDNGKSVEDAFAEYYRNPSITAGIEITPEAVNEARSRLHASKELSYKNMATVHVKQEDDLAEWRRNDDVLGAAMRVTRFPGKDAKGEVVPSAERESLGVADEHLVSYSYKKDLSEGDQPGQMTYTWEARIPRGFSPDAEFSRAYREGGVPTATDGVRAVINDMWLATGSFGRWPEGERKLVDPDTGLVSDEGTRLSPYDKDRWMGSGTWIQGKERIVPDENIVNFAEAAEYIYKGYNPDTPSSYGGDPETLKTINWLERKGRERLDSMFNMETRHFPEMREMSEAEYIVTGQVFEDAYRQQIDSALSAAGPMPEQGVGRIGHGSNAFFSLMSQVTQDTIGRPFSTDRPASGYTIGGEQMLQGSRAKGMGELRESSATGKLLDSLEGVRSTKDGTAYIVEEDGRRYVRVIPDEEYEGQRKEEQGLSDYQGLLKGTSLDDQSAEEAAENYKKWLPASFQYLSDAQLRVADGQKVKAGDVLFSSIHPGGAGPLGLIASMNEHRSAPPKSLEEWYSKNYSMRMGPEGREYVSASLDPWSEERQQARDMSWYDYASSSFGEMTYNPGPRHCAYGGRRSGSHAIRWTQRVSHNRRGR